MWGKDAVGKLVAGADALKPQVEVFVDDVAGPEVAQKVQRRLQHFIDRKIAALFEPLLNLSRDEELTGLARGFAFQMVEALGVLPRAQVADDVKALDQDARSALRKHGIRFGQFTIFLPLLLKPAPTRLRLVLWSLTKGLDVFPEAPPPGLVTIPLEQGAAEGADTMSGYRIAGQRAIRIDMLERLADMLRAENTRAGFEAKADMLSITGMTLEQFADLMQGLGYKAEKGERPKVKAAEAKPEVSEAANTPETPGETADVVAETADVAAQTVEQVAETGDEPAAETEADAVEIAPTTDAEAPETEVFYTFIWGRNPRGGAGNQRRGGERPQGKGRPNQKGKRGAPKGDKPRGGQKFSAKPPRPEKKIDPDNPFAAALMGLKDNK